MPRLRGRTGLVADGVLNVFTDWFCSRGGVWQTSIVTLAIVAAEMAHVIPDPHGFWLLYILTVYSAITQPALAYSGAMAAGRMEQLESQNRELLEVNQRQAEHIAQLLEGQAAIHEAVK